MIVLHMDNIITCYLNRFDDPIDGVVLAVFISLLCIPAVAAILS